MFLPRILFFTLALAVNAAGAKTFSSHAGEFSLVELYTSEGCHSCPPAERYFNSMKKHKEIFKSLFPVVYHVHYWDYLGWKDRLAHEQFTQRQRSMAKLNKSRKIYTPGVFAQGGIWEGWRRGKGIPQTKGMGELEVKAAKKKFTLKYKGKKNIEFHIVELATNVSTKIKAGERSGETVVHDFVVLGYQKLSGSVEKADRTLLIKGIQPEAVVAWVTEAGKATPLQIAGGWLK